ncbi:MAG: hypothetical protein ACKN87_04420, partial [Microcystis aeruginosa]
CLPYLFASKELRVVVGQLLGSCQPPFKPTKENKRLRILAVTIIRIIMEFGNHVMSGDCESVRRGTAGDKSLDVTLSTPMVRMPQLEQNLAELNGCGRTAPKENRAKIAEITDLYEAKHIANLRTAEHVVKRLNQKRNNAAKSKRAEVEHEKVVAKYRDAEPMTGNHYPIAQEGQNNS